MVRGFDNITATVRMGVREAVIDGAEAGFMRYQRTIALEFGSLRGVAREALGAVVGRAIFLKSKMVIPWSRIESIMVSELDYAKYHIRGHPDQAFFGGYKRPTTEGTRPINPRELMALVRSEIFKRIPPSIRSRGASANG